MAEINTAIDSLVNKVDAQRTVIDSVMTLVQGLKDQIGQIQGDMDAAGEAEAAAKLGLLVQAIDANTQRLADAIIANTPTEE